MSQNNPPSGGHRMTFVSGLPRPVPAGTPNAPSSASQTPVPSSSSANKRPAPTGLGESPLSGPAAKKRQTRWNAEAIGIMLNELIELAHKGKQTDNYGKLQFSQHLIST